MPAVEATITIAAPPGPLFALSQDYALRREWDPFVREMRFLGGATESAPGVRVSGRAYNGLTMEVEFVTVKPPHVVAMKMTRGPLMFERFAGSWIFEETAPGQTQVTFRYVFATRWPWLQCLLDPVIRRMLRRDIRARLRGLKQGAEQQGLLLRIGAKATVACG
jgi:ribosome-associated toxin RatA of RatAB toxin-antitoxin module